MESLTVLHLKSGKIIVSSKDIEKRLTIIGSELHHMVVTYIGSLKSRQILQIHLRKLIALKIEILKSWKTCESNIGEFIIAGVEILQSLTH